MNAVWNALSHGDTVKNILLPFTKWGMEYTPQVRTCCQKRAWSASQSDGHSLGDMIVMSNPHLLLWLVGSWTSNLRLPHSHNYCRMFPRIIHYNLPGYGTAHNPGIHSNSLCRQCHNQHYPRSIPPFHRDSHQ